MVLIPDADEAKREGFWDIDGFRDGSFMVVAGEAEKDGTSEGDEVLRTTA